MSERWGCNSCSRWASNNFCSYCGKPRPEPKKGLAQRLHDTYYKTDDALMEGSAQHEWWNQVATCALEHFVAESEKAWEEIRLTNEARILLRRRMEDSLNG